MTPDKMIEVIAVKESGMPIEQRRTSNGAALSGLLSNHRSEAVKSGMRLRFMHNSDDWNAMLHDSDFNFSHWEYRVRPEPREYWIWTGPENAQILNYKPVNQGFMHVREVIE